MAPSRTNGTKGSMISGYTGAACRRVVWDVRGQCYAAQGQTSATGNRRGRSRAGCSRRTAQVRRAAVVARCVTGRGCARSPAQAASAFDELGGAEQDD
jgi:hypothetical protein